MIDRNTKEVHAPFEFEMHRFQVGKCDVSIFVFKLEPRVFVGGGEFGYESLAREADVVEIEALAERFQLQGLQTIAAKRRLHPLLIDSAVNQASEKI